MRLSFLPRELRFVYGIVHSAYASETPWQGYARRRGYGDEGLGALVMALLVAFDLGATQSVHGLGQAAMGSFYRPADQKTIWI